MKPVHEVESIKSIMSTHGTDHLPGNNEAETLAIWRVSDDPLHELLARTIDRLAREEENLVRRGDDIIRQINIMKQSVESGHHINELGVLQRSGVELDQLCARRQELIDQVKMLLWVLKRQHVKVCTACVANSGQPNATSHGAEAHR